MITHFVIFSKATRLYVRAGKRGLFTYSLNCAKHFSTEWNAKNYLSTMDDAELYSIVKIVHQ